MTHPLRRDWGEVLLLCAAGAWALWASGRHPELGLWGGIPRWGTLVFGVATAVARVAGHRDWFRARLDVRVLGGLAPAFYQCLLEGIWASEGAVSEGVYFIGFFIFTGYALAYLIHLTVVLSGILNAAWSRVRDLRRGRRPAAKKVSKPIVLAQLSFGVQGPVLQAELAGPGEQAGEKLVESGTFRVDSAHAAETLGRFQLEDPENFLVPWLRCAVASEAKRIELSAGYDELTVRFDGKALAAVAAGEPLSGLLGLVDDEASRQLAIGLLALLRLSPTEVDIVSGAGSDRRRVRAPAEPRFGEEATPEGTGTVIRARWDVDEGLASRAAENLRKAYGMCSAELSINGQAVPDPATAAAALADWRGKSRGTVLRMSNLHAIRLSRVRFYRLGAFVEEVELESVQPGQLCFISDDAFKLDLSQGRVVKNNRYSDALSRFNAVQSRVSKALKAYGGLGVHLRAARESPKVALVILAAIAALLLAIR